jgi:CubicO group peptidase (beta-lactamase class C family)
MATGQATTTSNATVLKCVDPESQGIDAAALQRLYARVESHITAGWYPGAAVAMARRGTLVAARTFGVARLQTPDAPAMPADAQTL